MTETHSLSPARATAEDQWFAALDNRLVQVGTEPRRLRVLGVHRDGQEIWIQLTTLNESDHDFVIRCWHHQQPDEVLANVCVHLAASQSTPHTIDVRAGEWLRSVVSAPRSLFTLWGAAAVLYQIQ